MNKSIIILVLVIFKFIKCFEEIETGDRIYGGEKVDFDDVPFLVSLRYNDEHLCGGSIINSRTIVTAAHCSANKAISRLSVRAGTVFRDDDGQHINVLKVIGHPLYLKIFPHYDISILKLSEDLIIGENVATVKLPAQGADFPKTNDIGLVVGWGRLSNNERPFVAQKVNLPVISLEKCQKAEMDNETITDNEFCAGYSEGGRDACIGDSGGPFMVDDVLAGIVSWGIGCALAGMPGVYTKVSMFRNFIDQYA